MKPLQSSVRLAWEQFQSEGTLAKGIDPVIAKSWKRVQRFGVQPDMNVAPKADGSVFSRRIKEMQEVVTLSERVLARGGLLLRDSGCMIVMAAADGTVITTVGDERIIDRGRENHLAIGGQWGEDVIGTNAIGTSIQNGTASLVHGAQHFCEGIHKWSCAAAPIIDPVNGTLRAVLDISGASDGFWPQNFALAVSLAEQIKHHLALKISQEHGALLDHFIGLRTRWGKSHLMLFDRRGTKIYDTLKPDAAYLASGLVLSEMGQAAWLDALLQNHPNFDAELVVKDNKAVGAVLVAARHRNARPRKKSDPFSGFFGEADAIVDIKTKVYALAREASPIVISAEPGTGRRLLAHAIHKAAGGGEDGMAVIDYATASVAMNDKNIQSGWFLKETLCLDEGSKSSTELQNDLVQRLVKEIKENKRHAPRLIILTDRQEPKDEAASQEWIDPDAMLQAVWLELPPLRERGDDIIRLANIFIADAAARARRPIPVLSVNAQKILRSYYWPGNVRELRLELMSLVLLCRGGVLRAQDLPRHFSYPFKTPRNSKRPSERDHIIDAIHQCEGNMSRAARALGVARSTLYLKVAAYKITKNELKQI